MRKAAQGQRATQSAEWMGAPVTPENCPRTPTPRLHWSQECKRPGRRRA
jgi:hypothetical protein